MQLGPGTPGNAVRRRIGAAACALLAASLPTAARAEDAGNWTFDGSMLLYGEQDRAKVTEPVARISRLFGNGHRLSGQFAYDAITGASPSGALPSGQLQTTTTPSGNVTTVPAGSVPTVMFRDQRYAADLEWQAPVTRTVTTTLAGHVSNEKDYKSLGASGSIAVDAMQRLLTITAGAGYNNDEVIPVGGTRVPLGDGTELQPQATNPKHVTTGMLGFTRVLSRRWLVGLSGSYEKDDGYLTEPYKVVSTVDPVTQEVNGQVTEKRPDTRARKSVALNSVYHLTQNILYVSYRAYTDDWRIQSHTGDVRYRIEMENGRYLQPHFRYYTQTAASFYTAGLVAGDPLPEYASADYRLGPLRSSTYGLTYGFHLGTTPGILSLRGEYMRQSLAGPGGEGGEGGEGEGGGDDARGATPTTAVTAATSLTNITLPPLNVFTLLVGYSVSF